MVRSVRKPGMDSSLSSVPPVWPSARPEIMGTITPAAAASGAHDQAGLIAHAAGGMLVHFDAGDRTRDRRVSPERIMHSVRR